MVLKFANGTRLDIASSIEANAVVAEDLEWIEAIHGRLMDVQDSASTAGAAFEVSIPNCEELPMTSPARSLVGCR